mgnify:FL=1
MVTEVRTDAEAVEQSVFTLMEQMEQAEETSDPAIEGVGTVIQKPSTESPMAAMISEISGPGWVILHNTMTHEAVKVNKWNMQDALKKVHNDPSHPEFMGKPLFSAKSTGKQQFGQFQCHLYAGTGGKKCEVCSNVHPPHPDYEMCMTWGMKTCLGAHIPNAYEVTRHMEKRHKTEWGAIKAYKDDERDKMWEARRVEEVKEQQALMKILVSRATLESGEDAPKRGRPAKQTEE